MIIVLPGVLPAEDQLVADVKHRHPALTIVGELGRTLLEQSLLGVVRYVLIAVGRCKESHLIATLSLAFRLYHTAEKSIRKVSVKLEDTEIR